MGPGQSGRIPGAATWCVRAGQSAGDLPQPADSRVDTRHGSVVGMRVASPLSVAPAIAVALLLSPLLRAHEEPFGYVRGTQVEPKGEWEITQWATSRVGKQTGRYLGMDFATELEYGVTERFQASVYLTSNYHFVRNATGSSEKFDDRNHFGISGSTLELKYQITSPETSPLGFAVYFEPGYDTIDRVDGARTQEAEVEARFILQKNFFKGRLITALNYLVEPEWEHEGGRWKSELWMEGSLGASWALTDRWRIGIEGRVRTVFARADLGDSEYVALHLGPTLFYARDRWYASFTALPQVSGWPDTRGRGGLHLDETERLELRLKFGFEF